MQESGESNKTHLNPNLRANGQGEPFIGSIRGLNLAVVRPTTVQVTAISEW
jgi:hypothetical protein